MILIRVDGNEKIGLGHVMRCLSIADAFVEKSKNVTFVVADNKCESIITDRGFKCINLDSDYSDMEDEVASFTKVLIAFSPEIVIVDSYYVTERYLLFLRQKVKTVYIDDILSFPYPVDILINYNIFSSHDDYQKLYESVNKKPVLLLGTKYVPLRKEFSACKQREPNQEVKNIFVSTGGADPLHIGIKLLQYLIEHQSEFERYIFKYVVGSVNRDLDLIMSLAEKLPNVELNIDVKDMCSLMCECDLAISAAGSTLYELCAACVPTITYTFADNQLSAAIAFHEKGIMINVGDIRNDIDAITTVFKEVRELIMNVSSREEMEILGRTLLDGLGAKRISNSITNDI